MYQTWIQIKKYRPCRATPGAIIAALLLPAFLGLSPSSAVADDKNKTPAPEWGKGALYGRVVDAATGKPVPNATVAIQDKDGKVITWTKTDAEGKYVVAADTMGVLRLRPSRRAGLLQQIARGVGQIVTAPVKAVADTVKSIDPAKTVKAAALSAATGGIAGPVASQVIADATNKVKNVDETAKNASRDTAVRMALGERLQTPAPKRDEPVPGEIRIAVEAPGYKDLKGKAGSWRLEPGVLGDKAAKKPDIGPRAWLETALLQPAAAPADKLSAVENAAVLLADPAFDPALAPAGSTVKMRVTLKSPPADPPLAARIFARENKKGQVVELKPLPDNAAIYAGEMTLDPKTPAGDVVITAIALRAEPVDVKINKGKDDPLMEFAKRLDDLETGKEFEYDPRIMASENRLEMTLTVLDPKKATPPAAATAPAPEAKPETKPEAKPDPAAPAAPPQGTPPPQGNPPAVPPAAPPANPPAAPPPANPPAAPPSTPAPANPPQGTPPAAPNPDPAPAPTPEMPPK